MPRPRLRPPPPPIALVIEVLQEDGSFWHAMASEWERIMLELRNAPPALAITIHEWHLLSPINPRPGSWDDKYPKWKRIGAVPWTLDRG